MEWPLHQYVHAVRERHVTQICQRLSDEGHFMMHLRGFTIIDYIGDYVGVPSVMHDLYVMLLYLIAKLGLSISEKKLVIPSMQAVCLVILIDTQNGTISIPPEKLEQVITMSVVNKERGHKMSAPVPSRITVIRPQVREVSSRFSELYA